MNTHKKCAVFDLDGTLINTITDLGNACDYVLKKHGVPAQWTEADYKRFVGNGMRKLVERAFSHQLSDEQLDAYLAEFKAYYAKTQLDNTRPYPAIPEALSALKEKGIPIAVVTNKAEEAAIAILTELFPAKPFDVIIGQRDNLPVKPAPDGVFLALQEMGFTADEALYFGDSNVDMQTAQNAGIPAVGVTWGFRSREELEQAGAAKIIDSPSVIPTLF